MMNWLVFSEGCFSGHLIPSTHQDWKLSHVVPIPKITNPTARNDFRPIVLTSVIMKCFEKLVRSAHISQVKIDPFQFAYQANKGVDDAIMTLWHNLCEHLAKPKTYARILFADFSSAFNVILCV